MQNSDKFRNKTTLQYNNVLKNEESDKMNTNIYSIKMAYKWKKTGISTLHQGTVSSICIYNNWNEYRNCKGRGLKESLIGPEMQKI